MDDSNIIHELSMDSNTGFLRGRLDILNTIFSKKAYLNLLSGLINHTISYFALVNESTETETFISRLFIKSFAIQFNSGALNIRMGLEIMPEEFEEFQQFLQTHNLIQTQ